MAKEPRKPALSPYYGHSAVIEFESANKLTGLSHDYVLPKDGRRLTCLSLEYRLDQIVYPLTATRPDPGKQARVLTGLAEEIVALNPVLREIPRQPYDVTTEHALLRGVAYRYHPRDISWFLQRTRTLAPDAPTEGKLQRIEVERTLQERLTGIGKALQARNGNYTPPSVRWQMSPQTLDAIEVQIGGRAPALKRFRRPSGPNRS